MPPEAEQDGETGAVAFVEHWVELVNYGLRTGDFDEARALTSRCEVCDGLAETLSGQPVAAEGDEWVVTTSGTAGGDLRGADHLVSLGITIATAGSGEYGQIQAGVIGSGDERKIRWVDFQQR